MTDANNKRRVVVTGMGTINPLGFNVEETWANIKAGKSGIKHLTSIAPEETTVNIGGEITEFNPDNYMDKKDARRTDRYMQFALAASEQAYADAGLTEGAVAPERLGVILGSGAGGMGSMESQLKRALNLGFEKISPFFVHMMLPDSGAGRVSIRFNAKGPNKAIVTACSTGSDSIGEAMRLIQTGEADVMIAGGAEAPLYALPIAGFNSMHALSRRNDDPTKASRPFDKDRDGFVMGEGSGILILEDLEHAKARGAKIYAEITGYGCTSDANDIVAPCADGDGAGRAMLKAIESAGIKREDVQYINAHGTSTPLGDLAETLAIKRVFEDHASSKSVAVSSTKSMHGHLLGGAGALEAIVCIKSILDNTLPPTINLDTPDEGCDLDYVPNAARPIEALNCVMSNSFGFGGHNASLVFQRYSDN